MSTIPTVVITPRGAADAYAATDRGIGGAGGGFSTTLQRALDGAIAVGHDADAKTAQAISGTGNLTEVVTALSHAELALQTATAVRDRVVQAYQDIMKMPI